MIAILVALLVPTSWQDQDSISAAYAERLKRPSELIKEQVVVSKAKAQEQRALNVASRRSQRNRARMDLQPTPTPKRSPAPRRVTIQFADESGKPAPYLNVRAILRGRDRIGNTVKAKPEVVRILQTNSKGQLSLTLTDPAYTQVLADIQAPSDKRWDFAEGESALRDISGPAPSLPVRVVRQTLVYRFANAPEGTRLETLLPPGQLNEPVSEDLRLEIDREEATEPGALFLFVRKQGGVEFMATAAPSMASTVSSYERSVDCGKLPWRINSLPGLQDRVFAPFQRPEQLTRPSTDIPGLAGLLHLRHLSTMIDPRERRRVEASLDSPGQVRTVRDLQGNFEFVIRSIPVRGSERPLAIVEGIRILSSKVDFLGMRVEDESGKVEQILGKPEMTLRDGSWSYLEQGLELSWQGNRLAAIHLLRPIELLAEGLRPTEGVPTFDSSVTSDGRSGSSSVSLDLAKEILNGSIQELTREGSARIANPQTRTRPNYKLVIRPGLQRASVGTDDQVNELVFGITLKDNFGYREDIAEPITVARSTRRTTIDNPTPPELRQELVDEGRRSLTSYLRQKLLTGRVVSLNPEAGEVSVSVSSVKGLVPGITFEVRNFDQLAFPPLHGLEAIEFDEVRNVVRCRLVRYRWEDRPFRQRDLVPAALSLSDKRRLIGGILDPRSGLVYVDYKRFSTTNSAG